MTPLDGDKLRGHLEMLILATLEKGDAHGLEILQRIEAKGCGLLKLKEGSLYPALYRLEHQGWISSEWGESENKRKAKFYTITPAGRRQLKLERDHWTRFSAVISTVLDA